MPNWVQNVITVNNDATIIPAILDENNEVDFNLLIPRPKSLDIKCSSINDSAIIYFLTNRMTTPVNSVVLAKYMEGYSGAEAYYHAEDLCKYLKGELALGKRTQKELDEMYELGKTCASNMVLYGYRDWYHWSIDNWGTKWNACDTIVFSDHEVAFDTAWGEPLEIFEEICRRWPEADIQFACEGEDEEVRTYANIHGKLNQR